MTTGSVHNSNRMIIDTARLIVRNLQASDVSESYLHWFSDPLVQQHIPSARSVHTLQTLRDYVNEKTENSHAYFFGIFDRSSGKHIGNLKYEPINFEDGWAFVGILIGEPAWRGIGAFREAFIATSRELHRVRKLHDFWLGVSLDNTAAIKAYAKAGFLTTTLPDKLQHYHRPHSKEMLFRIVP
jgi:ribosomal-protein-alanine N-acetyltransferase